MDFDLRINYGKTMAKDVSSPEELTKIVINEAISRKFPQGMPRTESKIYARLQRDLLEDSTVVSLDQPTLDLIYEALDQAQMPAQMSTWKWSIIEALDELRNKPK